MVRAIAILLLTAIPALGQRPAQAPPCHARPDQAPAVDPVLDIVPITDPNPWQWDPARREWYRWVTNSAAPGRATAVGGYFLPPRAAPARFYSAPVRGGGGGC